MASNYLRDEERVVRYVPWGKLRRDEDDNVLGSLPAAFALREDEEYLSVTWCEYFAGTPDESLRCAIEAIRGSAIKVGQKARFAVGEVGRLRRRAEGREKARKLRIIHEPEDDNQAHAAIRHWPREDDELLELLAEDEWSKLLTAADADALPLTDCLKSERA
jgi:hypothetical protein